MNDVDLIRKHMKELWCTWEGVAHKTELLAALVALERAYTQLEAENAELRERVAELELFEKATRDALPIIQNKPEAAAAYLREHLLAQHRTKTNE